LHHKAAFASFAFSTLSVVAEDYSVRVLAPDFDLQSDFGLGVEQEPEPEPEFGSVAGAGVGFVSVALAEADELLWFALQILLPLMFVFSCVCFFELRRLRGPGFYLFLLEDEGELQMKSERGLVVVVVTRVLL
jgi:hypothetical protein